MPPSSTARDQGSRISVPFFDSKAQTAALRGQIRNAMERVISSAQFVLGEEVSAFHSVANLYEKIRAKYPHW